MLDILTPEEAKTQQIISRTREIKGTVLHKKTVEPGSGKAISPKREGGVGGDRKVCCKDEEGTS